MRWLLYGLIAAATVFQYPLWFSEGGVFRLWRLEREIAAQEAENTRLRERNAALEAEVVDLKSGLEAIEERARAELGMVKKGETFYQVVEPPKKQKAR